MSDAKSGNKRVLIDFDPDDPFAAQRLLAVVVAPFDMGRRRNFLAILAAEMMNSAPKPGAMLFDFALGKPPLSERIARYVQAVDSRLFQQAGGMETILDAPSRAKFAEGCRVDWSLGKGAGLLLLYTLQMSRFHAKQLSPSINRATAVMHAAAAAGGPSAPAERYDRRTWKHFRAVAPLSAAFAMVMAVSGASGQEPGRWAQWPGRTRLILGWAAWLQDEARRLRPAGAAGPLLPADEGVLFPPGIHAAAPPLAPLPPELLDAALAYEAPVSAGTRDRRKASAD